MSDKKWSVEKLDSGGRSVLKRSAGTMMGGDVQALEAFYRAVTYLPKNQEQVAQWYACLCMECLWKPEEHPRSVKMEEMLRRLYQNADTSESIRHRIISLMDVPWSRDGYLIGKLSNFARMMRAKDSSVIPDFDNLADDLARWNHPDRYVQRRWIRTICGADKEEKNTEQKDNEKEEKNNAD